MCSWTIREDENGWDAGHAAQPVDALARRCPCAATALPTGTDPDAATVAGTVGAARGADLVIVLTNNVSASTGQRDLVEESLATGNPVVSVAVQEPYDPGFAEVETWPATYDRRAVSMDSLARVPFGERPPSGRLPVRIPSSQAPDTVRYRYGHGLTW